MVVWEIKFKIFFELKYQMKIFFPHEILYTVCMYVHCKVKLKWEYQPLLDRRRHVHHHPTSVWFRELYWSTLFATPLSPQIRTDENEKLNIIFKATHIRWLFEKNTLHEHGIIVNNIILIYGMFNHSHITHKSNDPESTLLSGTINDRASDCPEILLSIL